MDKCFSVCYDECDFIPNLSFELTERSNQMKTNEGVGL